VRVLIPKQKPEPDQTALSSSSSVPASRATWLVLNFLVDFPQGIPKGQVVSVMILGKEVKVKCPETINCQENASAGQSMALRIPNPFVAPTRNNETNATRHTELKTSESQLYEVKVPDGIQPGTSLALLAGGVHVMITCPPNAGPGQRLRFKLPWWGVLEKPSFRRTQLLGWNRLVRVGSLKLQWVYLTPLVGALDNIHDRESKIDAYAFVRKLELPRTANNTAVVGTSAFSLVPSSQVLLDPKVKLSDMRDLMTVLDLVRVRSESFEKKAEWFQDSCAKLAVDWNEGHIRINVRCDHVLEDSVDAVKSMSLRDLRKLWRFEYIGKRGISGGGLLTEWYYCVFQELFDPDMGLWQPNAANPMTLAINPASGEISFFRMPLDELAGFSHISFVIQRTLVKITWYTFAS
jgi:hypothetical protein